MDEKSEFTHAELCRIVEDCEPLLRDLWARRKSDDDLIILGDLRRPENLECVRGWWDEEVIKDRLAGRGPGSPRPFLPFLPFLQPRRLLDVLLSSNSWVKRAAAQELRAFAATPGIVPLWLVRKDGHWATCWSPPGSNAVVARHQPESAPKDN
jgi:hypothetical protein